MLEFVLAAHVRRAEVELFLFYFTATLCYTLLLVNHPTPTRKETEDRERILRKQSASETLMPRPCRHVFLLLHHKVSVWHWKGTNCKLYGRLVNRGGWEKQNSGWGVFYKGTAWHLNVKFGREKSSSVLLKGGFFVFTYSRMSLVTDWFIFFMFLCPWGL